MNNSIEFKNYIINIKEGERLHEKILLVCNAGMSTSMLVLKMEKAAEAKGIEIEVKALPITEAEKEADEWDVVINCGVKPTRLRVG